MSTQVDVLLSPADLERALVDDVRAGLTACPKWLPPKWFYDARGSELFDRITRLAEYYPTRREREILAAHATTVAAATRPDTLVELGSGTSEKTRLLLDALRHEGTLRCFVPFDVSETTLREAADAITREYAGLAVHAVVGDFEHHLGAIPGEGRRLVAFLGGTIGNLVPDQRARFLADLAGTLHADDALLLGADLVKDEGRLVRAYDDAEGVTAEFDKNVLHVLNRELGATFDVDAFEHVARWDTTHEWIEMHLRATRPMKVDLAALGLAIAFDEDELLRTEISAKFRRDGLEAELRAAGLTPLEWWTDAAGDFAVSLSVVAPPTE